MELNDKFNVSDSGKFLSFITSGDTYITVKIDDIVKIEFLPAIKTSLILGDEKRDDDLIEILCDHSLNTVKAPIEIYKELVANL